MEPSPDDRLRALAASQDGLVTAAQALRVGLSYDAIRTRRRRGEWRALARGVYLLDADMYLDGLADRVFWRAALLAHGPGVCLVATTAAAALGMVGLPRNMRDIEIAQVGGAARHKGETATVVPGWGGTERGIVVRQLSVDRSEVVIWNGLPVRDAFHTAVDAALVVDRPTALALWTPRCTWNYSSLPTSWPAWRKPVTGGASWKSKARGVG
jgi:hypothetical protein